MNPLQPPVLISPPTHLLENVELSLRRMCGQTYFAHHFLSLEHKRLQFQSVDLDQAYGRSRDGSKQSNVVESAGSISSVPTLASTLDLIRE